MTHICVGKLAIISSDNGLSPGRRQAIIWTNAGILLIWPVGTNFSDNLIGIQPFSFKKIYLKMSSGKWRPLCLGLNVLTTGYNEKRKTSRRKVVCSVAVNVHNFSYKPCGASSVREILKWFKKPQSFICQIYSMIGFIQLCANDKIGIWVPQSSKPADINHIITILRTNGTVVTIWLILITQCHSMFNALLVLPVPTDVRTCLIVARHA